MDPITCTITFESETGIDYTLQWLDTGPGQWMTLETRAGNGSTLQFMDVPSTTPTAPHYRIVVEPALAR